MRVQQQPAFVLHHSHYGETSLLVEAFTRNFGRIGLVAKGARRQRSVLRATLAPFQPVLLAWSGRGELATLTGAEPAAAGIDLYGEQSYCGLYLNELLMRLLHRHDAHENLFDAYELSLRRLQIADATEIALRLFEKHLLQELGYGLVLGCEVSGNSPIAADAEYDYIPDRGPVPACSAAEGIRVKGASLLALAQENFPDPAAPHEAKLLMRACISRHLGNRPLHSRSLFRTRHSVTGHAGKGRLS